MSSVHPRKALTTTQVDWNTARY